MMNSFHSPFCFGTSITYRSTFLGSSSEYYDDIRADTGLNVGFCEITGQGQVERLNFWSIYVDQFMQRQFGGCFENEFIVPIKKWRIPRSRHSHDWSFPVGASDKGRTFPPLQSNASPESNTDIKGEDSTSGGELILVVDDDPMILSMMQSVLETFGYSVLAACSSVEAQQIARDHAGEVQMLITDIIMPGMNGRDLAENLMANYPNMKCLYMSGFTDSIIADLNALERDAHFIQKPFSVAGLASKVRELLDKDS